VFFEKIFKLDPDDISCADDIQNGKKTTCETVRNAVLWHCYVL